MSLYCLWRLSCCKERFNPLSFFLYLQSLPHSHAHSLSPHSPFLLLSHSFYHIDSGFVTLSQGGIFGSVYMSVTTDVTRGSIGVGGTPYSLLLPRSADFTDLFEILKSR